MSARTARWVNRTTPGTPPPPPSRTYTAPPPTVYPESSVSNPNASRYTGRSSRASSHASHSRSKSLDPSHYSGSRYSGSHHSGSHHSGSHHGGSHYGPSQQGGSHYGGSHYSGSHHSGSNYSRTVTPMQTFHAPPEQPIVARTSSASGKTSSYMIIPAAGHKVEILHPTPLPARAHTIPPSATYSPTKETPLIRRLFGGADAKSSASHSSRRSSSSVRSRRNSTGGSGVAARVVGGTVVTSSGTRVTSGSGKIYNVTYV